MPANVPDVLAVQIVHARRELDASARKAAPILNMLKELGNIRNVIAGPTLLDMPHNV